MTAVRVDVTCGRQCADSVKRERANGRRDARVARVVRKQVYIGWVRLSGQVLCAGSCGLPQERYYTYRRQRAWYGRDMTMNKRHKPGPLGPSIYLSIYLSCLPRYQAAWLHDTKQGKGSLRSLNVYNGPQWRKVWVFQTFRRPIPLWRIASCRVLPLSRVLALSSLTQATHLSLSRRLLLKIAQVTDCRRCTTYHVHRPLQDLPYDPKGSGRTLPFLPHVQIYRLQSNELSTDLLGLVI